MTLRARPIVWLFTFCFLCLFSLTIGCGGNSSAPNSNKDGGHKHDHDHDHKHNHDNDLPETFDDAVAEVVELRNAIRDAIDGDDQEKAHDPLHDIGHVLEALSKLVDASELSDEDKAAAKEASETLFDLFGKVDEKFHDKEKGSSYGDVAEEIDAAVEVLASKLPNENDGEQDDDDDNSDDKNDEGET